MDSKGQPPQRKLELWANFVRASKHAMKHKTEVIVTAVEEILFYYYNNFRFTYHEQDTRYMIAATRPLSWDSSAQFGSLAKTLAVIFA